MRVAGAIAARLPLFQEPTEGRRVQRSPLLNLLKAVGDLLAAIELSNLPDQSFYHIPAPPPRSVNLWAVFFHAINDNTRCPGRRAFGLSGRKCEPKNGSMCP